MAWYDNLDIATAAAKGYSATGSPYGKVADAVTGSLLNRKKKKKKVDETPSDDSWMEFEGDDVY